MRGGNAQRAQHVGERRQAAPRPGRSLTRPSRRRLGPNLNAIGRLNELRESRKAGGDAGVYRRRRLAAVALLVIGALALVFAVLVQTQASGAAERAVPIDPNDAVPDTVLAEVAGVGISVPVRPASLTGLGYHPEGESLVAMAPRGENLSESALFGLVSGGETPEDISYNVMDDAGREGPRTGALDVGAVAGTTAYAPVTGSVTSIRPDPTVEGANVVGIKPDANPDVRVNVALVQSSGGAGVNDRVVAGMTRLGNVADSAKVLDPQLSAYTSDAGNHLTITVSEVG